MKNLASLIVLAYERPEFLHRMMTSLLTVDSGYPMEIIVHNDGSTEDEVFQYLTSLAHEKKITILINNCGQNVGIEQSVRRGIACSSGDYIFKLDTDLEFTPGWLGKAVAILEHEETVGAVGLIDYRKYDPADSRFWEVTEMPNFLWVKDFVSSAYGFTRTVYNAAGKYMKHDGWHLKLQELGYRLVIKDVVNNFGFGRSIYVGSDGLAVDMEHPPLTF